MTMPELDQQTLDRIAEEFAHEVRSGNGPSIDEFVTRYPDRSGQLRQLLQSIEMIESIKQQSDPSGSAASRHELSVTELDDYRIVREIGRGGMGMVFEAHDQSLHRRVAIKVLPSGLLSDSRNLERFRREAKAAARLRHPNIVSVFGVGHADPYHYYVMDYIDGVNLRQWLGDVTGDRARCAPTVDGELASTAGSFHLSSADSVRESPPVVNGSAIDRDANAPLRIDTPEFYRWVASVGVMITDALEYAHGQGTLHRDIKPANLLLDHAGVVSITDFGLAKVAEHQPVTRTGDIVGTPQYMAPESFDGTYDVRSETYAVGLTLYELLTLRPAIKGTSPADTIRRATQGVTVAPRKINQAIPRPLETVLQKALAIDPGSRYLSAAELRDDLNCFLSDRPISARRSHVFERVARWSRREPVVATLTLATFASLFALTLVAAVAYLRTKSALEKVETSRADLVVALGERTAALDSAEQQSDRAEANLSVAIDAFDQIRDRIWQRGMVPDAEMLGEVVDSSSADVSPADAQILLSLLGFFDDLAANNSQDLRAQSAAAGRRAGDIYQRLGRLDDASRTYSDALKRYESLSEEHPEDASLVIEQARIRNEQIVTASLQGQIQLASIIFDQTVALLESAPAAKSLAEGRFEYARAHALFASIIARAGVDSPVRRFRSGGRPPRRPGLGASAARSTEERLAIAKAIEVLAALCDDFPDETKYQVALARAYREESKVAARAGRPGDGERSIKQSIDLFEALLDKSGDSDSIRYELAKTLSSSEALGLNQTIRLLRADSLSSALLKNSPTLPRYQALRAHVLEMSAQHRNRIGGKPAAQRNFNAALDLYDKLIEGAPEFLLYKQKKSQTLEAVADLKLRNGDRELAIDYLEQAIEALAPDARSSTSTVARQQLQRQRQKLNRIRQGVRDGPATE